MWRCATRSGSTERAGEPVVRSIRWAATVMRSAARLMGGSCTIASSSPDDSLASPAIISRRGGEGELPRPQAYAAHPFLRLESRDQALPRSKPFGQAGEEREVHAAHEL